MAIKMHLINPINLGGHMPSSELTLTREQYETITRQGLKAMTTVPYSFETKGDFAQRYEGEVVVPASNVAALSRGLEVNVKQPG